MKKKNILKIFSSILGVFSIGGLFVCSIFINDQHKKATSVKADNTIGLWFEDGIDIGIQLTSTSTVFDGSDYQGEHWSEPFYTSSNVAKLDTVYRESVNDFDYHFNVTSKFYFSYEYNGVEYYLMFLDYFEISDELYNYYTSNLMYGSYLFNCAYSGFTYELYPDSTCIMSWYCFCELYDIQEDKLLSSYTEIHTIEVYLYNSITHERILLNELNNVGESLLSTSLDWLLNLSNDGYISLFDEYVFSITDSSSYVGALQDAYQDGYAQGSLVSDKESYQQGYNAGVESQQQAITNAYSTGYTDGYNDGSSTDSTVVSIFSGILQVGLVPINFFLSIFNFEILGINLSAFVRALFTVLITIIVVKFVVGNGGGKGD